MSRHHHHHHQTTSRHHHHQKSRYRYDVIDDRPMLSSVEADTLEAAAIDDHDDDSNKYDEDVNRFLDEASEELFKEEEPVRSSTSKYEPPENPPESHDAKPNYWYQDMRKIKIRETKEIMEDLSKLACYTCPSIGEHIKRMEQDHGTTFCKMDYNVRHPPFNRPWTNTWTFHCTIKCNESGHIDTTHTAYCQVVVTPVGYELLELDYPEYVKDAVKLFEDFVLEVIRNESMKDTKESSDTSLLRTMWLGIKVLLRSNCRNDLMMIVRDKKKPTNLLYKLRRFFQRAPEAETNIVSVFYIKQGGFPKTSGEHVTGLYCLRDVVGPLSIEYKPKISPDFNAVEAIQLAKIIKEYAGLTRETTLLDIGCNFGVLSLMLSFECESVYGINTTHSTNGDLRQAEELKNLNKIHNVTFVSCNADELVTKCSSLIKQCITVAVLCLSPHYGKNKNVMIALRNLPSIWRVIVYGSFPTLRDYQKNINTLIESQTLELGERYLPIQGCILDKSSSVENAFNIVILFERQSLITPKVELFEAGPTLNIKTDSEVHEYGSVDVKPKREDRFQESRSSREEFEEERPSCSTDSRRSDYSRDDERYRREKDRSSHSSRSRDHRTDHSRRSRDDRRSPEERPHSASRHRSSFKDRQMLRDERFDSPPPRNHENHSRQSRDRRQRVSPPSPLSIPNGDSPPSTSRSRLSSTSAREKSPVQKIPQEPVTNSLLSVKKEFQFTCLSPPRERNPSPPLFPPAEESDFVEEDFVRYPLSRTLETEQIQPTACKENIVSSTTDDGVFKVPIIKPEPTYPESLENPALANIKNEPEDMDISPNHLDFLSMETPIHNPRDLAHPPLPARVTNFSLGEFEFPLQAHLSFLPRARHDEIHMDDLPDVSQIKKEKDDGGETLTTEETVGDTEVKKEKDAGGETWTAGEAVDKAPEIKMEKGVEDETLTTGETVDQAPEIKKEKDAGNETLTTGETVEKVPEIKKEKGVEDETLTTGKTVNGSSEIKKEKGAEGETLTTGEAVDEVPEIKKEKDAVDETLMIRETTDGTSEAKKEKDAGEESLATEETTDDTPEIKKEKDASGETLTIGESENEEHGRIKIKTEIVDPSYFAGSTEFNCENIPLPVTIKSEPLESHEIPLVRVKNEPVDMEIPPNPHNIESMVTSVHNPRILNDNSPVKINDLETILAQPNRSFLDMKREPEPSVNVKTEPDDEIAIIGEKRSKPKKSQPKIRVRNVDEIIKVKTERIETEDLQKLIEERQKILRKLNGEDEDTDLPRAYKRQSRSPSRKYKRSPNSSPRRYSRSPSPYYKRKKSRRSPPERRRRSPIRFKKEPISPTSDRRRERKRRSPSLDMREVYGTTSSRDKRSRRSRSRSPRRR